jgi:putative ABC transport system permease protein
MIVWVRELMLILRLTRRELRGGLRGFGVFLGCLLLGVFAISGIGSFTESAKSGLLADASSLLGGDLEVRMEQRSMDDAQRAFFERLGRLSHVTSLRTMARSGQATNLSTLVELKAVDSAYPLYGQIESTPSQPLSAALQSNGALAESSLLDRLGMAVGDYLQIGAVRVQIRGVLTREPDRTIRAFTLGPRLMISQSTLHATALIQPGSLASHAYRLVLPNREEVDAVLHEIRSRFPDSGWRLQTWREAAPRVRFFLDRMNLNMSLIGLCALLIGGLGVSGAVRGYLTGKINHIATMKCLGAPSRTIFYTYLSQILAIGAVGALAGLVCGASLPYLLNWLIGRQLPISLVPAIHYQVLLSAAVFGLLIALLFSLKALGVARNVSPAVLFRGYDLTDKSKPGSATWFAVVIVATSLALLAIVTSSDQRLAIWFIIGAIFCFAIFRLASSGFIHTARRLPRPHNPSLRLGLANIHRRGSPAESALFSIGLGLTGLVIVVLVQANLNDMVQDTLPAEAPAFFLLDIQTHQLAQFDRLTTSLPEIDRVMRYPTLRGRITAIDGVPVDQATIAPEVQWAVRGDRFLSYAASKPAENALSAGEWWPSDYNGPPKVSITADLAKGFGISVGDTLAVNVLGREITAEIASLREVDWSSMQLNFALLFAPGALEQAPQTYVASLYVPARFEDKIFKQITNTFPNVSLISTREVLTNVSRTLKRIGMAFQGMAAIALLAGFLVLAGAVSADQHRRIHDAVIFKVCGATKRDILTAFAWEFMVLGLLAGLISSGVGSLAAMGILEGLMDINFSVHPLAIVITVLVGLLVTLALGLLGTWKVLRHKPARYLRGE